MHDVPPASIVTDRHIVDSEIAERRDPDAMTALELSVPTESFERKRRSTSPGIESRPTLYRGWPSGTVTA